MMFQEKPRWPKKLEKSEYKENFESIVIETIKKVENCDFKIGEGKSGFVCRLENYSDVCMKIVNKKGVSKNRTHVELAFLDKLSNNDFPVPIPMCSVQTEKNDYLFMETIDGFSLKDLIENDLLDEVPKNFNFKNFFSKLREITKKMHDQKIYHRDLHEGNIMIDGNGQPIIIDFGDAYEKQLLSEDAYKETGLKGEIIRYTNDFDNINIVYRHVCRYLKEKFNNK